MSYSLFVVVVVAVAVAVIFFFFFLLAVVVAFVVEMLMNLATAKFNNNETVKVCK